MLIKESDYYGIENTEKMRSRYGEEICWKFTLNIRVNSIRKIMFRKQYPLHHAAFYFARLFYYEVQYASLGGKITPN